MTAERLFAVALHTIRATEFCFLVTLAASGEPHVRLMQPFAPEDDLTIWLGTSPQSRKVRDIQRDNRVTLSFHHAAEAAYVTLAGTAQIVDDPQARQRWWREDWKAFFPDGPTGDDYVLIRCTPARLELMNLAQNVQPEPVGLRHAVIVHNGTTWVVEP